jgi:nicotinate-nucleotide adenylyltransferase
LKLGGASASFEDRAVMTRRAIAGETGFALSYLDMPREAGAPNYTIDTLHSFRAEYPPQSTLFCLMGADSFLALRSWHLADEIPFAASLIVASRPGQSLQDLQAALPAGLIIEPATDQDTTVEGIEVRGFEIVNPAGLRSPFYLLPGLYVEISASEIRQRIETQLQAKAGTEGLLPESVANYIRSRGLYR